MNNELHGDEDILSQEQEDLQELIYWQSADDESE